MGVHNGGVRSDWSPEDIVGVGEVHDDDLVGFIDLFPDTDEVVGLQCEGLHKKHRRSMGQTKDIYRGRHGPGKRWRPVGCQ